MSQMVLLLLALGAGIVVGRAARGRLRLLRLAERATSFSIFLLLFLLGIAVGANEEIMDSLDRLGLEALVLSVAATLGSVLLSALLYRNFAR